MKPVFVFLFFIFPSLVWAVPSTRNFTYATYEDAKKGKEYLRFDMKSTKAGVWTTSFSGYVKTAAVFYENDKANFKDVTVTFKSKDLDTDNSSRNSKMWETCLKASQYSDITVQIPKIAKSDKPQEVDGSISILGYGHPIKLSLNTATDAGVDGTAKLSIKNLQITDPSIFVASVKDEILVHFHFEP